MVRNDCLKKDKTTFGIVDAKSIKNVDTAKEKGYDAGKKVSGIKLHLVVDTLGLPHAIHVTCANVTDRKGALEMSLIFKACKWEKLTTTANILPLKYL